MPPISRPLVILMGLTVMLMAVWVVALRPKPVDVKDTPLAPTTQISKAKGAAAASDAANAKVQAATGGTATPQAAAPRTAAPKAAAPQAAAPKAAAPKAAAPKAAAPKAAAPKAAAPKTAPVKTSKASLAKVRDAALVRDLKRGKVAVLLFWNPEAADDIAARGALRDLDLRGGKVVVRVISIDDVAQYESITSGVKIAGSPTTVIIGKNGHTRVIMGLTEPREVAQAVADALAGH
jgi:hypothetical protein